MLKIGCSQKLDTIAMYDYVTKTTTFINPVEVDTNKVFNSTPHYVGSLGNIVDLFSALPTDSLFEGVKFSKPQPAHQFYTLTDYPVRTAIKIFGYKKDTLKPVCSGMLVSENFVITAAHCPYITNKPDSLENRSLQYDSLYVVPAFDNGIHQKELPISNVNRVFVFKSFYCDESFEDYALLELEKPIGRIVGYTSIAFNEDPLYYEDRIFHKFSYPGKVSHIDSTLYYNGDTMFYNYGAGVSSSNSSSNQLKIISRDAIGIRGQSGSTFLYTNNVDEYYNFGTASFAASYSHYRITPDVFYQFKNILETYSIIRARELDVQQDNSFILHPNPTKNKSILVFYNPLNKKIQCKVFDVNGRQHFQKLTIHQNSITIEKGETPAGIYFIHLYEDGLLKFVSKLIFSN